MAKVIDLDEAVDKAVNHVELLCAPVHMTRDQALDFLEDVISRLEDSAEAIRDDLGRS